MFVTSPHNIDKAFPIHCRDVPWAIILRVTDTKNEQVDNSCQVERKLQRSMISLLSRSSARAGLEEGVNDIQPPADLIDAEEGTSPVLSAGADNLHLSRYLRFFSFG